MKLAMVKVMKTNTEATKKSVPLLMGPWNDRETACELFAIFLQINRDLTHFALRFPMKSFTIRLLRFRVSMPAAVKRIVD